MMARSYGEYLDCLLHSNSKFPAEHSTRMDGEGHPHSTSTSTSKTTYPNVDLNGSKVIRLVRAKQATKRKSSLDTLIEVVQKELLRVNGQSTCPSPSSSPPPPPSRSSSTEIHSVSPLSSLQDPPIQFEENIEEIVRDTVDKLVAITLLNNAPFFVNIMTSSSTDSSKALTNGPSSTNTTISSSSKPSSTSSIPPPTSDLALLSSTASDLRSSMPVPAARLVNVHTVLPKPTTNIQIGNTKIILVSPPTSSNSMPLPVKVLKFPPSTVPKNVQILLPSSTDSIPAASQEVTISSSPPLTIGKARRRSSTSTPMEKPVGKILRPIAKVLPVYSPTVREDHPPRTLNTINFPSTNPHGPMIYRMTSVNPNVPVFRLRSNATTSNELPPPPPPPAPLSVLACFKTTKKRTKERAIMPRPTTTTEVPSRLKLSQPAMEDKGIQCIDQDPPVSNSNPSDGSTPSIKRTLNQSDDEDCWTVAADTLLRNVLSQYGFRFLDVNCQQNLSSKFDAIQADLVSGMITSREQFYQTVLEIKDHLLENGLSKISADNLEKLFHYFRMEYPKFCQEKTFPRTNERKRTRRQ